MLGSPGKYEVKGSSEIGIIRVKRFDSLIILCLIFSSPWRIVDDCGGAFAMGAIGGSLFQAIKGFRNAPAGMSHRFTGSLTG